ncbi:hypothetical protein [Gelidibacter sp.]|uniref:hypothetical protein n=1 Tax=Gelidibacter sp. TaxID=2018083 RepID=UPI0032655E73
MPKIKINTFGEGIEIRQLHLDVETYQHWSIIAAKRNRVLTDLVLDPFFYYGLKDKKIKGLSDIDATLISGMLNTSKSQIEIWFKRRKVLKLQSNELFNGMVLFPLFQVENNVSFLSKELENGIYVIQKTIGLLRSEHLEVTSERLNVDDFTFAIANYQTEQFLTDITYQNQKLKFKKSDTIITYQTAFEVK